jgi:outer membrane protein assembly factor BamB
VFTAQDGQNLLGRTEAGEFVVSRSRQKTEIESVCVGPIEVRDAANTRTLRSVLNTTDDVRLVAWRDGDLVAIHKDNVLSILRLPNGEPVVTRQVSGTKRFMPSIVIKESIILLWDDSVVTAFDLKNGDELWATSHVLNVSQWHGNLLLLQYDSQSDVAVDREGWKSEWRNAITGEIDRRFGSRHVRAIDKVSPDGKWGITFELKDDASLQAFVIDLKSGERKWELPENTNGFDNDRLHFSADSSRLFLPYGQDRTLRMACWSATDGHVHAVPPDKNQTNVRVSESFRSEDNRSFFARVVNDSLYVPRLVQSVVESVGIPWDGEIRAPLRRWYAFDAADGAVMGIVETLDQSSLGPTETGFARGVGGRIEFYDFPFRRDWWRLVRWALLPIAIVWGLAYVRASRRNRMRARTG